MPSKSVATDALTALWATAGVGDVRLLAEGEEVVGPNGKTKVRFAKLSYMSSSSDPSFREIDRHLAAFSLKRLEVPGC